MIQIKPGSDVRVWFLDHVEDHDEAVMCKLLGEVIKFTDTDVTIDAWVTMGHDTEHNRKRYTLVRSAILRIDLLPEGATDGG